MLLVPLEPMYHYILFWWAYESGLSAQGKALTLSSMFEAVGAFKEGKLSKEAFLDMEQNACPTCGSCAGMFTANSMNCLMEVLGLALPYNGTALAVSEQRREMIREVAFKLVDNIKKISNHLIS